MARVREPMSTQWQRIWEVFHAALEQSLETRAAFVDGELAGDTVLRDEVHGLLAAHAREDQLLDHPPLLAAAASQLAPGSVLGRYRILRELGQGGMGRVYLVERSDGEYDKHGALKVLDPTLANAALIDSFLRERQILAHLEHPHIARLLDGGRSATGLPYLIMEYVDGVPIDRHCSERALGLDASLALMIQVCETVDFAHRQLIVHRDIKPGNVLVNARGEAVLLDFGIAGQLGGQPGLAAALTPDYASPEQLAGETIGVASDVYSLGVMLFELLAGERPYPTRGLSLSELSARIRRAPAPVLRTRRSGLPRRLPAELDWICAKAMQAQPDRRYRSAEALAADLRAVRTHHPVAARPASATYGLRKLVRRRWPWFSAAALLLTLSAAFVWQLDTERRRTHAALEQTRIERDRAERVVEFLSALFRQADTTQAGGQEVSARELLDRGRKQLDARDDLPATGRLLLLNALAEVYRNMGASAVALALLKDAQQLLPEVASTTLEAQTLLNLGQVHELEGEHAQAKSALQRALALRRAQGNPAAIAQAAEALAISLQALGERAAAGELFAQAYAIHNSVLPVDLAARADAALRLGSWYWVAGELEQAARYYAQALAARRAQTPADLPELARTIDAQGGLRHAQGLYAQAASDFEEAVALRRRILGNAHRHTADSLSNLGAARFDLGDDDAAQAPLREALAIYTAVLPPQSPVLAKTLNNLGLVLLRQNQPDEARAQFERALLINRAAFGESHARVAGNLNNLGLVLERQEHLAQAADAYAQATAIQEQTLGARHPQLAYSLTNLARVQFWLGHADAAIGLFQRALAIREATIEPNHPAQAETLAWYGHALCAGDDRERGLALLRRARTIADEQGVERSPAPEARAMLGACELRGSTDAASRQLIVDALPRLRQLRGAQDRLVRALEDVLAR